MPSAASSRPDPSEYHPAFASYVAKAGTEDPRVALQTQLENALALLRPLEPSVQSYRYAPGKWSIKQLVGHISDAERVFAYRALRIGRGDQTPLPPFDENLFGKTAGSDDCEWESLLDEFEWVRRSSIALLRNLPEGAWGRAGEVNGARTTLRGLAYVMVGHAAHHLEILRERYL